MTNQTLEKEINEKVLNIQKNLYLMMESIKGLTIDMDEGQFLKINYPKNCISIQKKGSELLIKTQKQKK